MHRCCSCGASAEPRLTRGLARWVLAAAAGIPAAAASVALGADRFDVVPLVYTQSPGAFRSLFLRARCETTRVVMLGDSQETCPAGRGSVYMPRFNFEFARLSGNAPETPWVQMNSTSGNGQPWGDWLLGTALAAPGPTFCRVSPGRLTPGMIGCKVSTMDGANINNNQFYGQLAGVKPRSDQSDPDAGVAVPAAAPYFQMGSGCYLDVMAATNPSSGEVQVRVEPSASPLGSYFQPIIATFQTSMGLQRPTEEILVQRLGPLPTGGLPFLQIELGGTDSTKFTDIIAARFVSTVDSRGWVVQSVALGGYSIARFFERHARCGPVITAMRPDAAFIALGTNDVGFRSLTEFEGDVERMIDFLRASVRPDLPIVMITDPYRLPGDAGDLDRLDRIAGVFYNVARRVPNTCALNSRRALESIGWTSSAFRPYIFDGVHYSPFGASLKAQVEVSMLVGAFGVDRCVADMDDDCGVTIDDAILFFEYYGAGNPRADLDNGQGYGLPDGGVTTDDLVYFLTRLEGGC